MKRFSNNKSPIQGDEELEAEGKEIVIVTGDNMQISVTLEQGQHFKVEWREKPPFITVIVP